MNHDAYIDALKRSAARLPAVLAGWDQLDEDLRMHYADTMVELLCERGAAKVSVCNRSGGQASISRAHPGDQFPH
jgi:hypothetical protein